VVTDFPTFGSTTSASVFGTAVRSSPFSLAGKQAAFGGARGRGSGFDEEEEEEEEHKGQTIGFREDAITFEQVRASSCQSSYNTDSPTRQEGLRCKARGAIFVHDYDTSSGTRITHYRRTFASISFSVALLYLLRDLCTHVLYGNRHIKLIL
jgi:hypothetical protein